MAKTMNSSRAIDEMTGFLLGHLRAGTSGAPLCPAPASRQHAYLIQDQLVASQGDIAGWKVGRGNTTPEPYCAPILRKMQIPDQGIYTRPPGQEAAKLEAEIGFVVDRDVKAGASEISRTEVLDLFRKVVPAIEILETRLSGDGATDPLWKLADLQANGGVVFGDEVLRHDRVFQEARLSFETPSKSGPLRSVDHPFGDPVDLLHWLVNHIVTQRGGLRKGQVIITGSFCGILTETRKGLCRFTFDGVGSVGVTV